MLIIEKFDKEIALHLFSNYKEKEKLVASMSTLSHIRIPAFLATSRIAEDSAIQKEFRGAGSVLRRETSWGFIEIRDTLLGQDDALIFLALMATKKNVNIGKYPSHPDHISIDISLNKIARILNIGVDGRSLKRILNSIKKIKNMTIIREKVNSGKTYKIIERVLEHTSTNNKNSYTIVLGAGFYEELKNTLTINFEARLKEINDIKGSGRGYIQSIIIHFLSHEASIDNQQNISLPVLFLALGINKEDKGKAILAINRNIDQLQKFGIYFIDKGLEKRTLVYTGTHEVFFIPVPKSKIKT